MHAKVVDASVLGAIVFGEPRRDEAVRLLGDAVLYAPSLLSYELLRIAQRKIARYPDARSAIIEAHRLSTTLAITMVTPDPEETLALALETGLTTYDASYLSVARRLGVPLVTFDKEILGHLHD